MKSEITLKEILQIEDSVELLAIFCPDTSIPLWTTIRSVFLRMIMDDLFFEVPAAVAGGLRSRSKLVAAAMISKSVVHNALQLRSVKQKYPISLMATGARLSNREGRYFNCLSDYFVAAAPDRTFAVEDLFDWKWPFPRHHNNLLIHTPLRIEGRLRGWLRIGSYREPARTLVNIVSQRAKDMLGWDVGKERRRWLEVACANGAASLLPRYRTYQSIFKKVGAQILIKEEACYGGADNASAILAAKHLGIVTAEYQHGTVSSGHDAYNYASSILNNHLYRQIFPNYFLTFGSWWAEQINVPIEKIAIGNPHRTQTLGAADSAFIKRQKILVLGDGAMTTLYLRLCEQLAIELGSNVEVVFRPHPLERANVWAQHPDGFVGKVRIDGHKDIYLSFSEAGAVVSEVSTGLFEAIGLVPKIFLWDTPRARFGLPIHPFQCFSDVNELMHLIRDKSAGRVSDKKIETVWAPNWQCNYLNFLEKAIR
jgi:hypothetical protein